MANTESKSTPQQWLPIIIMFVIAVAGRLLPHPPNVTPLGGIALFGAAILSSRWLAVLLPFAALYISDLVLNNVVYAEYYEGFTWGVNFSVYLGFLAVIALGYLALRNQNKSPKRLFFTTLSASLAFYYITNFFSWYADPLGLYADNFMGLLTCYIAALPFLFNSLLGDLFFVGVLFSAYAWYQERILTTA